MRLFLDANVLFTAAHNPSGKAAFVRSLGALGIWQVATSGYAFEEARRNIQRKYPERAAAIDALMQAVTVVPDAADEPCPATIPDNDRPIYRSARGCGADVLLSGDLRAFGALMDDRVKGGGLLIQTVAGFLNSV